MMDLSLDAGAGGAPAADAFSSRQGRRFATRHAKRARLVDLESLEGPPARGSGGAASGGMFGTISLAEVHAAELEEPGGGADPADQHEGAAVLCWLSETACIGLIRLDRLPGLGELRLHAAEAATRCTRALCGANDCCEEQAFVLQLQAGGTARRSFIARRTGVGDYVVLTGRHLHFNTGYVPGEALREQAISRHFGHLPAPVRRQAVLCIGRVSFTWQQLGSSGAGGEPSSTAEELLSAFHPEAVSMAEEPSSAADEAPGLFVSPGTGVYTAPGSACGWVGEGTRCRSLEGGGKTAQMFITSSSSNGGGGGRGAGSPGRGAQWDTGGGGEGPTRGGGGPSAANGGGVATEVKGGGEGAGQEDGGGSGGGGDSVPPPVSGVGWLDWSRATRNASTFGDVSFGAKRELQPPFSGAPALPPYGIMAVRGLPRYDVFGLSTGRSPVGSSHADAVRPVALRHTDTYEQEGYAGDKSSDASSENEVGCTASPTSARHPIHKLKPKPSTPQVVSIPNTNARHSEGNAGGKWSGGIQREGGGRS